MVATTANHTITIKPSPTIKAAVWPSVGHVNNKCKRLIRYEWPPQGLSCYDCATPIASQDISSLSCSRIQLNRLSDYDCTHHCHTTTEIKNIRQWFYLYRSVCQPSGQWRCFCKCRPLWHWAAQLSPVANHLQLLRIELSVMMVIIALPCAFITVAVGKYPTIDLGPIQTLPTDHVALSR